MINNDNRTPSTITNPSLCIRRDTPKPSWLGAGSDALMGREVHTRIPQIIELVKIVQCEW